MNSSGGDEEEEEDGGGDDGVSLWKAIQIGGVY